MISHTYMLTLLLALSAAALAQAQMPPPVDLPGVPAAPPPAEAVVAAPPPSGVLAGPAVTTPDILPAVPAGLAEAPEAPKPPPPAVEYSYGNAPYSLLFTPGQIESMKQALSAYEALRKTGRTEEIKITDQTPLPLSMAEPSPYPVFHLASIAYRAPGDWTVWVGPNRITPKRNDWELRVMHVTAKEVQFAWKPDYMPIILQRKEIRRFAPVGPIRHKLTSTNSVSVDPVENQVLFSLRPNQSFSAAHLRTFEGNMAPVVLPRLVDMAAGGAGMPPSVVAPGLDANVPAGHGSSQAEEVMDEMMNTNNYLRRLAPRPPGEGQQQRLPTTAPPGVAQ